MKDIKSFCKLFDLNVPSYDEFEYYKNQYYKLPRWSNIDKLQKLFEEVESEITNVFEYKINKTNEIIDYLKSTRAYNELNDDNLIPDLFINKNFEFQSNKKYVSIDIVKANWEVFKKYDPSFVNELGDSYSDLLNKFNIPEVFHYSKHFRQYIFGHLNPKRQVRAQRVIIEDVINSLRDSNLKLEFIKYDEVIYSYKNLNDLKVVSELPDMFRVRPFTVELVEDFRVHSFYDFGGNFINKELVGCNGNKYFIFLKKYILNEPLDIRDLYFRVDGDLAIWNIDDLKVELC
jgi:hypothetical protein